MNRIRRLLLTLAAAALALPATALDLGRKVNGADALLSADEAFRLVSASRDGDGLRLSWLIAPGYYLYRHRLAAEAVDGARLPELLLPAGTPRHDAHFGDVEIYTTTLDARLPLAKGAAMPKQLKLRWQGCAEAGVCYPPVSRTVDIAP